MKPNREAVLEKLSKLSLFKSFAADANIMNWIYDSLESKSIASGTTIIREGDLGDEMYILLSGEIEICKNTLSKESFTVAKLKDSMNVFFGEIALVDDDTRSASVLALSDCELMVLKRTKFNELGAKHSEIGYRILSEIAAILSKRLRKANEDSAVLFETLLNELAS